jgi:hypothetical protein
VAQLSGTWHLSQVVGAGSGFATPSAPAAALLVKPDPGSGLIVLIVECNTATASATSTTMVFRQEWVNDLMCSQSPFTATQANWFYMRFLTGTVTWQVAGNVLTITKSGIGSATFNP